MPEPAAFLDHESYYATLTHELLHWTKHETRLKRDLGAKMFGDEGYAREEIVAELGSAFVCAALGICPEPLEEHDSYLSFWVERMRDDPKYIFKAVTHAQHAADFLLAKAQPT